MVKKIKVVWMCPYPANYLLPEIKFKKNKIYHPAPWIVNLLDYLAEEKSIDLHVVLLSAHVFSDQIIKKGNITFHIIKRGIKVFSSGYPTWLRLDVFWSFSRDIKNLLKKLDNLSPDVVHGFGTEVPYALAAAYCNYPNFISLQGIMVKMSKIYPRNINYWFMARVEKETLKKCRNIISQSAYVTKYVLSQNNLLNVFETKYIVDKCFYKIVRKDVPDSIIAFVGSTTDPNKGFHILVDAYIKIRLMGLNFKLLVIGGGKNFSKAQNNILLQKRGMINDILFVGRKTHEEISEYYKKISLLIVPSRFESYSMTVAEALVSGVPVIAYKSGGIPSLIEDGVNGFLYEDNIPEKLYSKVKEALSISGRLLEIGMNARNRGLMDFNPGNIVSNHLKIYYSAIKTE